MDNSCQTTAFFQKDIQNKVIELSKKQVFIEVNDLDVELDDIYDKIIYLIKAVKYGNLNTKLSISIPNSYFTKNSQIEIFDNFEEEISSLIKEVIFEINKLISRKDLNVILKLYETKILNDSVKLRYQLINKTNSL